MSHTCLVCGYQHLKEPPYKGHGFGSYEICASCGFQYGYDDQGLPYKDTVKKGYLEEYRREWSNKGYPWFSQSTRQPDNWDGKKQLEQYLSEIND